MSIITKTLINKTLITKTLISSLIGIGGSPSIPVAPIVTAGWTGIINCGVVTFLGANVTYNGSNVTHTP